MKPTFAATINPGYKPKDPIRARSLFFCANLLKGSENVVTVHINKAEIIENKRKDLQHRWNNLPSSGKF